ncbi:uncharacterized protein F5147DRAFT_774854 [Suillus discolor]|uniref:Uncharacterized protein n=1 Tax=Suillus discolor TaxID=1912936 RepID=A0A9P7JSZ3_9AGAM|nr:uncharacterized protein F5147DRAFT_774854 [Suillus discolor]KAG2106573.1 hypothetical protein F5147DRAFT_774854 [Suillus discolor]
MSGSPAVEITGLIDLSLSCTRVNKDARTEDIVRTQELTTTYNNVVQPPSPIKLTAPKILIDVESSNMVVDQPLSTLLPGRSFTAHFRTPDTHSYHDIVKTKKKHQADLKKRQTVSYPPGMAIPPLHFDQASRKSTASRRRAWGDCSHGTVRGEANKVAHRASAEDLTLAITGYDLTALQAKTLQGILDEFAHHEIP